MHISSSQSDTFHFREVTRLPFPSSSALTVECVICAEGYDELTHCPRLLSCGHTFCSVCLKKLIKEGKIPCPLDRKVTEAESCDTLPKNYAILDVITDNMPNPSPEADKPPMCVVYDTSDSHIASHYCVECTDYMCQSVASLHKRMRISRDHSIVSVDLVKRKPKETVRGLCDAHSRPIEFFDTSCQHFVCGQCVLLTHNGHTLQALDEAAEVFRNRIGEFVDQLSAETQRMKLAEDVVIRVHEDLSSHRLQSEIDLTNSFAKVTKQPLVSSFSSLTVRFLIHIFF